METALYLLAHRTFWGFDGIVDLSLVSQCEKRRPLLRADRHTLRAGVRTACQGGLTQHRRTAHLYPLD
jgi:hypothetical protein